jgi:hypothetical protein
MNLQDALDKAGQTLDEERVEPTVRYEMVTPDTVVNSVAAIISLSGERHRPTRVQEHPEHFLFKSQNFDLLCALWDQIPERDRPALLAASLSRALEKGSYRHRRGDVLGAGQSRRCTSALPLVAEFVVRRGGKSLFTEALGRSAPSPGLTLMLVQLDQMIALNFTLFTDEQYAQLRTAIEKVKGVIVNFKKQPTPSSTIESNAAHYVCKEVPGCVKRSWKRVARQHSCI